MKAISDEKLHRLSLCCDKIRGTGPIPLTIYTRMLEEFAKVPTLEESACGYLLCLGMRHKGECVGCDDVRQRKQNYKKGAK